MALVSRLLRGAVMGTRNISTSRVSFADQRSLLRLKKLQAEYQAEDGRPIWLKAGLRDRLLYTATIFGCVVGLLNTLFTLYDLAKPASWRKPTEC